MTQEDKKLLLQDLCARLPYGVICTDSRHGDSRITEIDTVSELVYFDDVDEYIEIKNCKPYLRSMSSMTMGELREWLGYCKADYDCEFKPEPTFNFESCYLSIKWLTKNHFDYCGLIDKNLAIEVTNENNPYK